jgi:hypothetical protein
MNGTDGDGAGSGGHGAAADDGSAAAGSIAVPVEEAGTAVDSADTVAQVVARRPAEQVEQLRLALEQRGSTGSEARDLTQLLEHQLAHCVPGDDEQALDTLEVRKNFLEHRFERPLRRYEGQDGVFQGLDTFLNVVSIVAGVGASLAASVNAAKVLLIGLGLLVGTLQSISQWLKPAQKASQLRRAAADMRQEAWDLLQGQNRYSGCDPEKNWVAFCAQINKVEEQEEAQEDQEAASSGLTQRLQTASSKLPGGK